MVCGVAMLLKAINFYGIFFRSFVRWVFGALPAACALLCTVASFQNITGPGSFTRSLAGVCVCLWFVW